MNKQEVSSAIGIRIRYYRHLRNMSQEQVALLANLNPAYFGQVERGLKCPTIDTLYRIASALEIPLTELVRIDTTNTYFPMNHDQKLDFLLARVPADKQDQMLKVVESVVNLF